LPYRPQRARPYIYTNQEIELLLAAARSLPPAGGLRGWKYHCLLGLLSVTGLRLGEALNLKLDDIDLHNNVLTIEKAKFGKSRLVPIHPSTRKVLVKYLQRLFKELRCSTAFLLIQRVAFRRKSCCPTSCISFLPRTNVQQWSVSRRLMTHSRLPVRVPKRKSARDVSD
jgi:integrase